MLPGAAASPVPTGRDDGAGQPPQAASLQQGVASAAGQEALLARCKLIFLGDSVRASGLGAVASPSTLGAILAAELAANALWKTHEAQVRQRFAPVLVAKQEVFGYLLNDIAGKQLLHSDYAMTVGQRGDNAVAKAKSQLKLKSAAACLATSKPAAAAVLASTYDLKLPNVTVGGIAPPAARMLLDRHAAQVQAKIDIAFANYEGLVARTNRAEAAMWRHLIDGKIVNERAWYAAREKHREAAAQMKAAGVAGMAMVDEAIRASKAAQEEVRAASPRPNPNPHPNPNPNQRDESGDEEAWGDSFSWAADDSPMHVREELEQMLRAVAMTATGWTRCIHCTHLLVQSAGEKFDAPDRVARREQEQKTWEQAGVQISFTPELKSALTRADLLEYEYTPFDGEALLGAAAVAQGCSKCAPVRAGVLTGAGMDATIVARMATAEVQALEQILRCRVQQAQQAGKRKIAAL